MPNIFDTAIDTFISVMTSNNAVTIHYQRDTDVVCINTAWIGETKKQSNDRGNSKVEWWDRQYFIPVNDLKIEDAKITPQEGDRITQEDSCGNKEYFEILSHETEPAWEYLDYQKKIWQLRVKQVNVSE